MTHTLIIYNQKKLIISALALIIILFPLNMIIAIAYLNALACGIGCVLIIPLILIISSRMSKSKFDISLNENSIKFGDTNILLSDIDGYYINKESPTMTQIEFRDTKNNDFSFTSLSYGQTGKDFKSFLSDFLKYAQLANPDFKQLSFYDFHKNNERIYKNKKTTTNTV